MFWLDGGGVREMLISFYCSGESGGSPVSSVGIKAFQRRLMCTL
jgi:hypothetical protein